MMTDDTHVHPSEIKEEMHELLCDYAADPDRDGVNGLRLLMALAGVMVEASFMFDEPHDSLDAMVQKLARRLMVFPSNVPVPAGLMPAAYIMDDISELGRDVARHVLKNMNDDPHDFADIVLDVVHHHVCVLESIDIPRDESFRMLCEFSTRSMVLEVAAQELCEVLLDHKIAIEKWSLGDCISALSGLSGYKVAVSYGSSGGQNRARLMAQSKTFDHVAEVLTREAVRYGIAGGTDWRFGLPANDIKKEPPSTLISGILPFCESFFRAVRAYDPVFQAVACAKAAGRMLAVASGGELPELSPVISKPLALCSMTDSYHSILMS